MAAVIGARLLHHLTDAVDCKKITLWSARSCYSGIKPLKRFILNRIREIKELTISFNWKYCPTNCNAPDLLTRGIGAKQCNESSQWKYGPKWLTTKSMYPELKLNRDTSFVLYLVADEDESIEERRRTLYDQ